jgi:hypothetical protein
LHHFNACRPAPAILPQLEIEDGGRPRGLGLREQTPPVGLFHQLIILP